MKRLVLLCYGYETKRDPLTRDSGGYSGGRSVLGESGCAWTEGVLVVERIGDDIEGIQLWGVGVLGEGIQGASDSIQLEGGTDTGGVDAGSCEGAWVRFEVVLQSWTFGAGNAIGEFEAGKSKAGSMCVWVGSRRKAEALCGVPQSVFPGVSAEESGEVQSDSASQL